jgi:hypothetical protein
VSSAAQHNDLLAKHHEFSFQPCSRSKQVDDQAKNGLKTVCIEAASSDSISHDNCIHLQQGCYEDYGLAKTPHSYQLWPTSCFGLPEFDRIVAMARVDQLDARSRNT